MCFFGAALRRRTHLRLSVFQFKYGATLSEVYFYPLLYKYSIKSIAYIIIIVYVVI